MIVNLYIEFSKTFQRAMDWLENKLVKDFEAEIIFNGGDNLLACLPVDYLSSKVFGWIGS